MSTVTRCPSCVTLFKVVADQLRVSQGWVRCGNCSDVFDAQMHFQSEPALAAESKPRFVDQSLVENPTFSQDASEAGHSALSRPLTAHTFLEGPAVQAEQVAKSTWHFASSLAITSATSVEASVETPTFEPPPFDSSGVLQHITSPSFVKSPHSQSPWHTHAMRFALAVLATMLLGGMGLQWILYHKDQIAFAEPRSATVLRTMCKPLGCVINPVRRIESLVIDSASFIKVDNRNFRLSFLLKNTAETPLEAPLLELSLSDSQEKTVVRRVLSPAQFGLNSGLIAARSETSGLLNLSVSTDEGIENPILPTTIAGYRVLVFYP